MNTEEKYGLIARGFHWIIAVLILGLLPVGLFMGGMENSPLKFEIYAMHKSFGLLVFFLGLLRLFWRWFVSPPPEHMENHAAWERTLSSAAHFWLYICIIGMPLSGWLLSSAGEFPVPFFGVQMPLLMAKNESLGNLFSDVHAVLAYTLLFTLALHAAGALKHHIIDKDETLQRMTFRHKGLLFSVLIVVAMGSVYAVCGYLTVFVEEEEHETPAAVSAPATPTSQNAIPSTNEWTIVPSQSKLQFQASLYNTPFTGEFKDFSGTIIFDPADLADARADIRINMKDVVTGDADRDKNILGPEWFDVAKFPESRFETVKFEKADENNYVAIGNLTIRDITLPLILPFTLNMTDKQARVNGKAGFGRLSYGIGTGQWEDGKTVGPDVEVLVDLTATK